MMDFSFDIGNCFPRHFNGLPGVVSAFLGPAVSLFGSIAALASVTSQFPADGAGMNAQVSGDVSLRFSSLLHGIDFDTIFLGELFILLHKCSV